MDIRTMADKIQALMAQGKTLEEAIGLTMTKAPSTKRTGDKLQELKEMRDLSDLRAARKIAYASLSKSKNRPEAVARYKAEIEAATERLNELLAEVNAAEIPWKKALELGDTVDGAFQFFIQDMEQLVNKELDKLTTGLTKAQIKASLMKMTRKVPSRIPEDLRACAQTRVEHNDMRVITLIQKIWLIEEIRNKTGKGG